MTVYSLGPSRAVGGREIDIQRLKSVFVIDAIREDLRSRVRGTYTGNIRQVMKIRWELMRKRGDTGGRPLEIGSLTITALPQASQLPYPLRDSPLPRPRLLMLLELIEQVEERRFLLARHVILEEICNVQQQRDINIDHGRVQEHRERARVAIDGLL